MRPVTDEGAPGTPGERLKAAIEEAGLKVRGYARTRAQREHGPKATFDQIENKRRQLNGWLSDDRTISDRNAEQLSADLGKPADYFKTPRKPRARRADEIAEVRGQLDELRGRLDGLEQQVRSALEARRPRRAGGGSPR